MFIDYFSMVSPLNGKLNGLGITVTDPFAPGLLISGEFNASWMVLSEVRFLSK
jgi:hypothetical protein